jgi:ATP-dependent helicase/nuclease subunit A
MKGDVVTGQPAYVPLEQFAEPLSIPSVIALPVPRPYGRRDIAKYAIEESLPAAVGGFIEWLLRESGWKIRDPERSGELIPIESRHIAILFRRFISRDNDVTREYVHELENRNIPHVLWGSRSFHEREEVETVRAALNAIEWPDDELSVFATLKGSLFAVPDHLLLRYRVEIGSMHPFRPAVESAPAEFKPVTEALSFLAELHRKRNWRSAVETVHALLETARAHAAFALRPSGNQVLLNVYHIADLARAYELSGGISFRGFVELLNQRADREGGMEPPVLEDAAEGVRIMTVHAAKGLEFPIVILADMTAKIAQSMASRYIDPAARLAAVRVLGCSPWELLDHNEEESARDEAEGVRVAYVAATRARDILVVPAVGDGVCEGWLSPLNKAIYPPRARFRNSSPAPECPEFGEATVLYRPLEHDGPYEMSVKPGLHEPEYGNHRVVWWDPAALKLNVEARHGINDEDILAPDDHGRADESVRLYAEWNAARAARVGEGARRSLTVFTPTTPGESIEPPAGYANNVEILRTTRAKNRPGGSRFGSLVHIVLRDASFTSSRESLMLLARTHGRLLAATDDEVDAAATVITNALKHPLFERIRASERVHRELPITIPTDFGIFEGVIDLAFFESGRWIITDFKTDADQPTRQAHYRRQVGWYVYAMEKAAGAPAAGLVLHI